MITVFVWSMGRTDPAGHASMQVGTDYISWFPEHFRSDVGLHVGMRQGIRWGGPSYANSMQEDLAIKGRRPDYASAPIRCLNEDKIRKWWTTIAPKNNTCRLSYSKEENTHYDLARLNCSTIVLRGLLVGGAGDVVRPPVPLIATALKGFMNAAMGPVGLILAEHVVGEAVTPHDVRRYAEALGASEANR